MKLDPKIILKLTKPLQNPKNSPQNPQKSLKIPSKNSAKKGKKHTPYYLPSGQFFQQGQLCLPGTESARKKKKKCDHKVGFLHLISPQFPPQFSLSSIFSFIFSFPLFYSPKETQFLDINLKKKNEKKKN